MKFSDQERQYLQASAELNVARQCLEQAKMRVAKAEDWLDRAKRALGREYYTERAGQ